MFSEASAILSTRERGRETEHPPPLDRDPSPLDRDLPDTDIYWRPLQQSVRILLEWILVFQSIHVGALFLK